MSDGEVEATSGRGIHGAFTFRGQLLDYRDVASRTKMQLVLGMNSWTKPDCASRGKRLFGVHRHGTVWRRPSRCPTQWSLEGRGNRVSKLWEHGSRSTVIS